MKGQWIGTYKGVPTSGEIVINIDERENYFEGMAYLFSADERLPSTVPYFRTHNKDRTFELRTHSIESIDVRLSRVVRWDDLKSAFPGVAFPQYADVKGSWDEDKLEVSWVTDIGSSGNCTLPRSKAADPSELAALEKDWVGYKEYVGGLAHRRYLFRGQNCLKRLRTSFHRTGRSNLVRFQNEDVPTLYKHLSARTRHLFNLDKPDEYGSFFNLVQHYGYPTPLLDWTFSPYVAAFFAYRRITNERAETGRADERVRILVFDQQQWKTDWRSSNMLLVPARNVSVLEFIAIENERLIPQQAASTVSNIDDIESYVKSKESKTKKYLWAIDLPMRDRRRVVRELSSMGITAGSLFPGLDGACEELTERNFEI